MPRATTSGSRTLLLAFTASPLFLFPAPPHGEMTIVRDGGPLWHVERSDLPAHCLRSNNEASTSVSPVNHATVRVGYRRVFPDGRGVARFSASPGRLVRIAGGESMSRRPYASPADGGRASAGSIGLA